MADGNGSGSAAGEAVALTKKDFSSDQEVRWCPGCGDYSVLTAVQLLMPDLGVRPENTVFVSGIGCSSRFPYYMNTYGIHSIHGRAPAVATGGAIARPELDVWVITGDGDGLSIGGNHLIHALRRNMDLKILMFNNRIYGLTKGQYSPTSEQFKKTKSTPYGSLDRPFEPLSLALGAGATFVARSVDVFSTHLREVLRRAAAHKGSAFIEILQNCNIFNDGAWEQWTDREVRDDQVIQIEDGKPLVFGKEHNRGIRRVGDELRVVDLGADHLEKDLVVYDSHRDDPALAFEMATTMTRSGFPLPIGIFRDVAVPSFEALAHDQMRQVREKQGRGSLESLISAGETWEVS